MKVQLIGEPKIIMSNPHSKHNYFGWPTVTRLQNGKLAAAASGYRLAHVCPFGKSVISYSEDEGETWTIPAPYRDTVLDDRDGGILAFDEKSVLVTSFNNRVEMQRTYATNTKETYPSSTPYKSYVLSYLDTVTQEEEERDLGAVVLISHDYGVTFDKTFRTPIMTPHGPIQLKDGSIFWIGEVYGGTEDHSIQAYRLNPEDGSSEYLGRIVPPMIDGRQLYYHEPYVCELEDSTILCHIRTGGNVVDYALCQSVSRDGGRTWSEPVPFRDDRVGAPAHILRHSSGALISVTGIRWNDCGVNAMISKDEGKTWDIGHEIYNNHGVSWDLGYPATVELKDGSLLTVFYAHPEEGAPAVIMQQRWKIEE